MSSTEIQNVVDNKSQVKYTIIAPNTIEQCTVYGMSVTIHDPEGELVEPASISVCIKRIENEKEILVREATVKVPANATEKVAIELGELSVEHQHKLMVDGLSGVKFHHDANLSIQSRSNIILIQSDKAIYKPGDVMQFRVIVLDPFLKPVANESDKQLSVFVIDSCDNRVKQWTDVERINGVFSSKMQLSDLPNLGSWKISAKYGEETTEEDVVVEKYVLPKFEVSIETPDFFVAADRKVTAMVKAKYTYGKPMSGRAELKVSNSWQGEQSTKSIDIVNGLGVVEFDMNREIFKENESRQGTYIIEATVTEKFTESSRTCSKSIIIHKNSYDIKVKFDHAYYSPDKPFDLKVSVRNHDGSPVKIEEDSRKMTIVRKLCVSKQYSGKYNENTVEMSNDHELDDNGDLSMSLSLTKNDVRISILAIYMDQEYDLRSLYLQQEDKKHKVETIDAEILTPEPFLNQNITVRVQSSELLKRYTYVLVSRKKIVEAKTVSVPDNESNFHEFTFAANESITPELAILIYVVKNDNIWSKKLSIPFKEDLKNPVDLSLSNVQAGPGDQIDVNVKTNAKSFVGLLGIDKSILLLRDGNDLDREMILRMMIENFTSVHPDQESHYDYLNSWSDFKNINIIFFTNVTEVYVAKRCLRKRMIKKKKGVCTEDTEFATVEEESPTMRIRKEFPETWIWDEMTDENFSGSWKLSKKVPDTMTTWIITAFAVDPVDGLGLCRAPAELTVFQPFFVSLNLPYSIKRGEILTVPCIVFNYTDRELQGEITLENEHNEFEFVDAAINDQIYPELAKESIRKKKLWVAGNEATVINFIIKPTRVGQIAIKVLVKTPSASDGILQMLNVEAEGITQYFNQSVFIDLREKPELQATSIPIVIPQSAIPDSTRIEVTCLGDLLGGCISNLQNLIRKPYGCGEQNMLGFVPNIVVLNYLRNTDQLTSQIKQKATQFMEIGYQRELGYRHHDGSFSAFGSYDDHGSTWLTAFVVKSFKQAAEHITVSDNIIKEGLEFLSQAQVDNGSFVENGSMFCKEMQGGAHGLALTAYVLTAFLECKDTAEKYQEVTNKATKYVVDCIGKTSSTYTLAIAAYALQLADHPAKTEVLQNLLNKAKVSENRKWWADQSNSKTESSSFSVEQTSYALLTLLKARDSSNVLPIIRYLLSQRNKEGGFNGTQDTILGLQALAQFAETIGSAATKIDLSIKSDVENTEKTLKVTRENALVLQRENLSPLARTVTLSATGAGLALFEVGFQYNIKEPDAKPDFQLKIQANQVNKEILRLELETSYQPLDTANEEKEQSNMTILEAHLPSGYVVDTSVFEDLVEPDGLIKRVETKNDDTVAIIYFDHLKKESIQVVVNAYRIHEVAEKKPTPVIIYDYYDSALSARQFYSIA